MIAGRFLRANWIWVLAVGAGFLLRVDQLGNQIVGDDEWHSLIYLQNHGYADIATHLIGQPIHCSFHQILSMRLS